MSAPLRQAALLAVLAIVTAWSFLQKPGPPLTPPPRRPAAASDRAARPATAAPTSLDDPVRRNLFEYGEAETSPKPAPVSRPTFTYRPTETPTAVPLKLVGLVQQAGGLRAALALDGEIVLGTRGQKVGAYRIESIDEDSGVVLMDPDGKRIELRPQPQ